MQDSKYKVLQSIFEVEDIEEKLLSYNSSIPYHLLLSVMSRESYDLSRELGVNTSTSTALSKYLWPSKPRSNSKICGWLLLQYDYKFCSHCKLVKEIDYFSKNASRQDGLNTYCKECYKETTRVYHREYQKTRKLLKISRVPAWADIDKIREIYNKCPLGYHVDHIVPIQGKNVSGLHVENNLQYLTAQDNLRKHNKFTE